MSKVAVEHGNNSTLRPAIIPDFFLTSWAFIFCHFNQVVNVAASWLSPVETSIHRLLIFVLLYIFAEEILGQNHAMWFAPNGQRLAYVRFNDTDVSEIRFYI